MAKECCFAFGFILVLQCFGNSMAWIMLPNKKAGYVPFKKKSSSFCRPMSTTTTSSSQNSFLSSTVSSLEKEIRRKIPILYEDERIIILNKPPGIPHHDDEGGSGIVTLVREQQNYRVWGVHRLDRVTSGILIMTKDEGMAKAITKSFANGEITKLYLGISSKKPTKKKQGWVQGGMIRSRDKSWKLIRNPPSNSNNAHNTTVENYAKTRFFTAPLRWVGRGNDDDDDDDHEDGIQEEEDDDEGQSQQHHQQQSYQPLTLILFRPYTGKTHQLRVASKSMGLPLWGDPIYKDGSPKTKQSDNSNPFVLIPNRTYLHASGIVIPPLLDRTDPLVLWCPPPFAECVQDDGHLNRTISDLMEKRCDIPELVEAMKKSYHL